MDFKKTILIDLDGVLNNYNGKFDASAIPPLKAGAKEFLETLAEEYELQIFTTRNKLIASKWLIENDLEKFVSDVTNVKTPAYLHIDDRCICFNGNYDNTISKILNFKVWYK